MTVLPGCAKLFAGTASCALRRFDDDGVQESPTPHMLFEQPDAADTIPTGLAVNPVNGDVFISGPTGFFPNLRLVIEKFNFALTSGGEWLDLTATYGIIVPAGVPPTRILDNPMVVSRDGLYLYVFSKSTTVGTTIRLYKFDAETAALVNFFDLTANSQTSRVNWNAAITFDGTIIYWGGATRGVIQRFNTVTETAMSDITIDLTEQTQLEALDTLPNGDILVSAYTSGGVTRKVRRLDSTGVFQQEYANLPGPTPIGEATVRRLITTAPDGLTFWTGFGSRPPGPGAFVVEVDVVTGIATVEGDLTTPYPDDSYTQLATSLCFANFERVRVSLVG